MYSHCMGNVIAGTLLFLQNQWFLPYKTQLVNPIVNYVFLNRVKILENLSYTVGIAPHGEVCDRHLVPSTVTN